MGSQSHWPVTRAVADTPGDLGVSIEARVISAHRTPDRLFAFAKSAWAQGFKVIVAGARGVRLIFPA